MPKLAENNGRQSAGNRRRKRIVENRTVSKKLFYTESYGVSYPGYYTVSAISLIPGHNYVIRNPLLSKTRDESFRHQIVSNHFFDDGTNFYHGYDLQKIPHDTYFEVGVYSCSRAALAQAFGSVVTYPITVNGVVVNNIYDLTALGLPDTVVDSVAAFDIPLRPGETDFAQYAKLIKIAGFSTMDSLQMDLELEYVSQNEMLLFVPTVNARAGAFQTIHPSGSHAYTYEQVRADAVNGMVAAIDDDVVWFENWFRIFNVEALLNFNLLRLERE